MESWKLICHLPDLEEEEKKNITQENTNQLFT